MSFYEKYLKYKQKYIQLKNEYNFEHDVGNKHHNNWIGGKNISFDLTSIKMRSKVKNFDYIKDIPINPVDDFSQTEILISEENLNLLFNELDKYNFSSLPKDTQKKILMQILYLVKKNYTIHRVKEFLLNKLAIKVKGGGNDVVAVGFQGILKENLKKGNIFIANFELDSEEEPKYTGDPAIMVARIIDVYKQPVEKMSDSSVIEFERSSWLTNNGSNMYVPSLITRELLEEVYKMIIIKNKKNKGTTNYEFVKFPDDFNEEEIFSLFLQTNTKRYMEEHPEYQKNKFVIGFKNGVLVSAENAAIATNFRIFSSYNDWRRIVDTMWLYLICRTLVDEEDTTHIVNSDILISDFGCNHTDSCYVHANKYTADGISNVVQLDLTKCYDSIKWPVIEYLLNGYFTRHFNARYSNRYGGGIGEHFARYFIDIYMGLLTTTKMTFNDIPIPLCTSLPTGPISSAGIIAFIFDELIYLWLQTIRFKINHDFIIKIYVDDIYIKLISPEAIASASEIIQSLWNFIQSFLFTINLVKSTADPALKIMIKKTLDSSDSEPLPALKDTDKYLGIPYTRDINKYFNVILAEFSNKRVQFKSFNSWYFIYNIIDNPAITGYLKWKLKPFFPEHETPWTIKISDLKKFVSEYLKQNGIMITLESLPTRALLLEDTPDLPLDVKFIIGSDICLKADLRRCGKVIAVLQESIVSDQRSVNYRIKFEDGEIMLLSKDEIMFPEKTRTIYKTGDNIIVAVTNQFSPEKRRL
jgi:hypothetical protein